MKATMRIYCGKSATKVLEQIRARDDVDSVGIGESIPIPRTRGNDPASKISSYLVEAQGNRDELLQLAIRIREDIEEVNFVSPKIHG